MILEDAVAEAKLPPDAGAVLDSCETSVVSVDEGDAGAGEPGDASTDDADSGEAGAREDGAGAEEDGAGAGDPCAEDADSGEAGAEEADWGEADAEDADAEPADAELPVTEATGHMVVLIATMEVTTLVEPAGQLVTVGAQLVIVETMVLNTVEVVIGVPFENEVVPSP